MIPGPIDPSGDSCWICGELNCLDHAPVEDLPPRRPNGRDYEAEAADARAAHQLILTAQETSRERARRDARRILDLEDRGPLADPVSYRLRDWLTVPDPEVRWRIHGWQPADSRVLLAAAHKSGKTTLVASLVRSLVDGDPWLGAASVTPITAGHVAIFDTEMAEAQLRRWYRDQGILADDRVTVYPLKGQAATLDLLDPACRARWAATCRADQTAYLVLDNLRPILDALGLDENHEAGRWLVAFDALLREAGIAEACLVHHMGHAGERSRGDSRLRDWPDVEWRMMRADEHDASARYIAAYGRDVDVGESQLVYAPTTRRLTLSGGSRASVRTTRALDAIVAALQSSPEPMSGRSIKAALAESEHKRDTIDAALNSGLCSGRLVKTSGAHRANLYRASVSECPGVSETPSGHSPTDRVSECPTAFSKADTPDTPPLPLDEPPKASSVRTDDRRSSSARSRTAATRNTPRTRQRARENP